ncbi:hypothetical protein Tco_0147983, partial [Tanacetum coccineum]
LKILDIMHEEDGCDGFRLHIDYFHKSGRVDHGSRKMRLKCLKGLIDILTPLQSVEFLVAAKKLHLSLHELSKRRDISTGVTQLLNTDGTPPKP